MADGDQKQNPGARSEHDTAGLLAEDIRRHKDAIIKLNEDLKKHQKAILDLQKRLAILPKEKKGMSLDAIISLTYRWGVGLTMLFFLSGMIRFYVKHQSLNIDYNMFYKNFYQFTEKEMQFISLGHFRTDVLLNAGLMILLITPLLQIVLTGTYMVTVQKNWKYGVITLFVLGILSISLLLH